MLSLLIQALERAVNTGLAMDPQTLTRLKALQGKVIKLEISDWQLAVSIMPGEHGVSLYPDVAAQPDTVISGKLTALFRVGCARGSQHALFDNGIEIRGDMQVGEQLRSIITSLDIDWEEQLSHCIGDIAAFKVGRFARGFRKILQRNGGILMQNTQDFLQLENRLLPAKTEIDAFTVAVSELRNAADRAEARIERLIRQRDKQP